MDSLVLHNFKAFRDIDIDIQPLTLLTGMNGCGKSTVLQALALLRQSFDLRFLEARGLVLNGELVELGTGADLLHDKHDDEMISLSLKSGDQQSNFVVTYEPLADVLDFPGLPNLPGSGRFAPLFGNCFQYLRADRASPAVSYPKSHHVVSDRRFLGSRGEFTAHYLHSFRDAIVKERGRRQDEATTPGLLTQVNAWMNELSTGAGINVEEVPRTDLVRLDYAYGGSAGLSSSNRYRPTNVGFGLTYSLPVLVACLASPNGSWIMIENPEAHLHPRAQATMGELLARTAATGVQVLAETHSDHVLNGVRLAVKAGIIPPESVALHFFRRGEASAQPVNVRPRITPEGRLSDWPDGFFDQWDKALDQLLG